MSSAPGTGGQDWPYERTCTRCGKQFCVTVCEEWSYYRKCGQDRLMFCSWGCMRKWDRDHADSRQGRKDAARQEEILRLLSRNVSNSEIRTATGASDQVISYYRRKRRKT